jgi:glycosyltransferase involved in cell wall biosynthesis
LERDVKIHLVGMPHHRIERDSQCSFSANAWNFREMMQARGHEVISYDGEATPDAGEWDPMSGMWLSYNARLTEELRWQNGIICLITGAPHRMLLESLPERPFIEISPGYIGILDKSFRVFESYAWMHWTLGTAGELQGRSRDTVIPHFYDPERFPLGEGGGGYLLFCGRANTDKGTEMVLETAHRAKLPLVTTGFGDWPIGVEQRGFVDVEERNKLMGGAVALICPTQYVEPGGHVASEALMCGTPVITSTFGCFTEFVSNGENGFQCRTVDEMVLGVKLSKHLDRQAIREMAVARFARDAVAPQFEN